MKIGIANYHHGIELKKKIINYFNNNNIEYVNYGSDIIDNVDYTEYAIKLCKEIKQNNIDLGILICGTGIGMSIIANKIKGILCAKITTPREAELCKMHNMANVIALSEYTQNVEEIIDEFINTEYSTEEKHKRRVNRIKEIENE